MSSAPPPLWLLKFTWSTAGEAMTAALQGRADAVLCRALDADLGHAYLHDTASPGAGWLPLHPLLHLRGAAAGGDARYHYVVETDVLPEQEADFNDWYDTEHLPGLAAVPGTVHAARYRCDTASPRYYACYDLADRATFGSPDWLAVRGTAWSSRVRPAFRHTRRTMFERVALE
ncbi:hypothetical protein M8A51_22030 [Schlegelella sp. S2-27]|uniref:Uncharacterized protein n=1 Tax=Caldimonas mangrovi TaxID=2944811 RepID=A0ABT0YVT1_9BURK|nr:DUF4286 family protein [Caldimonas mangrovi]MCM5682216.1 hypothetical protein [Caldimonas mangrovi]